MSARHLRSESEQLLASPATLFVDFDGTIAHIVDNPADARITPENLETLVRLSRRHNVVILSGRTREFLQQTFQNIPVTLAAEHGFFLWEPSSQEWITLYPRNVLLPLGFDKLLAVKVENIPGATLEKKACSLVLHLRSATITQSVHAELYSSLKPLADEHGLNLLPGKQIFEFRLPGWGKGEFVSWYVTRTAAEKKLALLGFGDDLTDEEMFEAIEVLGGLSVKIGDGDTRARLRLDSVTEMWRFLNSAT